MNNYELYFEPIKRENTMPPLHKTMFLQYNEFNLARWGTIEIWPRKQALVKALYILYIYMYVYIWVVAD